MSGRSVRPNPLRPFPGLLRAGTRGSPLALAQTRSVCRELKQRFPGLKIRLRVIRTTGDKSTKAPLSKIGAKGLFTKEIERALLSGAVDFAVHSLKDLETAVPAGLEIGAVLKRLDPADVLLSQKGWTLRSLPRGAVLGTSSLRRRAQLLALRPDLRVENMRGNLDTRVQKLATGDCDAILLARAGIERLGPELKLRSRGIRARRVNPAQVLPAVGQGALAVQVRAGDDRVGPIVKVLHHPATGAAVRAERSFLSALQGGCQVPIGARATLSRGRLALTGVIASLDGKKILRGSVRSTPSRAEEAGRALAQKLLRRGGRRILAAIRD